MNPLLWIAGGGLAAYLFLRQQGAAATVKSAVPGLAGAAPPAMTPAPTIIAMGAQPPPPAPSTTTSPPLIATWQTPGKPAPPKGGAVVQLNGRWVWPVPRWQGRAPVISDGFGSQRPGMRHMGVDIMFARIASAPFPNGPNGSKGFVMPDAWMAIAASDGVLWSSGRTPRGYAVVVDHGSVATFYTHLETLFVPEVKPMSKVGGPPQMQIKAGQPLGVIGADPMDGQRLKHLHFELWAGGPSQAVDPQAIMKSWEVVVPAQMAPFLSPLTRNAKTKPKSGDGLVYVHDYYRRAPGTALNFA